MNRVAQVIGRYAVTLALSGLAALIVHVLGGSVFSEGFWCGAICAFGALWIARAIERVDSEARE